MIGVISGGSKSDNFDPSLLINYANGLDCTEVQNVRCGEGGIWGLSGDRLVVT